MAAPLSASALGVVRETLRALLDPHSCDEDALELRDMVIGDDLSADFLVGMIGQACVDAGLPVAGRRLDLSNRPLPIDDLNDPELKFASCEHLVADGKLCWVGWNTRTAELGALVFDTDDAAWSHMARRLGLSSLSGRPVHRRAEDCPVPTEAAAVFGPAIARAMSPSLAVYRHRHLSQGLPPAPPAPRAPPRL